MLLIYWPFHNKGVSDLCQEFQEAATEQLYMSKVLTENKCQTNEGYLHPFLLGMLMSSLSFRQRLVP